VAVGGLDALTEPDAAVLERFMRARGGCVALLADARVSAGPVRKLIGDVGLAERLSDRPERLSMAESLPALEASELLVALTLPASAQPLASSAGANGAAAVFALPRGNGRLVFSGALDAWRFRAADHGAFDRFWQSAIGGFALHVPPRIDVAVEPRVLAPGERAQVIVRVRDETQPAIAVSLDDAPVRVWPDAERGVFGGFFEAPASPGRFTISVRADAAKTIATARSIVVQTDVRTAPAGGAPLALLAESRGGVDVSPGRLGEVKRFLASAVPQKSAPERRHPMRSPVWLVPFAACLGAEWWLRRRAGLR
jgi:hypothetical protein